MALRMRKSIQICKGVKLNVGTSGVSLSLGTKGLRHTIHSNGKRTSTVGIPGTGISYSKTHNKKQKQKQQNPNGSNEKKVEEYSKMIQALTSIHCSCDETINWKEILTDDEPLIRDGIGPKQAKALETLKSFRPGFFEKLKSGKKKAELEEAVKQAAEEDVEDEKNRKTLRELAKQVISGDIDAYLSVIYEMNPLDDLLDFGSDFEFGSNNPSSMQVEFRTKTDKVIPAYSLSLTKTGKLSKKDLTKTAYYGLMQDFVCSCAIRIARDIFALLPVDTVLVHSVENRLNTETGQEEDITILSVVFERDVINGLNFDKIDPSDAINNFPHHMKFLKTAGFRPVERIDLSKTRVFSSNTKQNVIK